MAAFAGFALVVAALFGLYAVAFVYTVEDRFFEAMLEQEATTQLRHHAASGRWARPQSPFMAVHGDTATLPEDLAARLRAEPRRTEFSGAQGRHYHLRLLQPVGARDPTWLVAEVSGQLVVRPMREQLLRVLAWTGLLVVALALGLGYWLARRTAKPLSRLAALVEGMTPEHMPASFAQDFADDEVGVLARGLEGLVGRVRAFIAREQEFTRDASHELRTPLAVIRGATERLAAEPHLSGDGRRHLDHVWQSAEQLEQTVTTLLSLAREDAAGAPATTPVALLPVLERVIVEQSRMLEGKPVTVEVQVPHGTTFALPAPVLQILLSNLVGNAFAHAECGQVRIEFAQGRLCIANRSPALSAADLNDLYQPFRKREGSAGFGLGLSIVRRLCDRHAIDLRIDSTGDEIHASFAPVVAGGDARL